MITTHNQAQWIVDGKLWDTSLEAAPLAIKVNRVGLDSGVYALGAPRQLDFGLRLTFYVQKPGLT
jgi:hypothetical protein